MAGKYRDPAAHEPSDSANVFSRFMAFVAAAIMAGAGVMCVHWYADEVWSEDELSGAVHAAGKALQEKGGAEAGFEVELALADASGGKGAVDALDVAEADGRGKRFDIRAAGVETRFCMSMHDVETGHGTLVPGGDGTTMTVPEHRTDVRVSRGRC